MVRFTMARKPTGKPTGAPEKEINWEMFEDLCSFQCTQSEISSFFKINKTTLIRRAEKHYGEDFATIYRHSSEKGLCSLRRTQFVLAKKSAAMAIHLGKALLGQREVVINESHTTQKSILKLPDNGRRSVS